MFTLINWGLTSHTTWQELSYHRCSVSWNLLNCSITVWTSISCRWRTLATCWHHSKRAAYKGGCSVWSTCDRTKLITLAMLDVFELQRVSCRKLPIWTYLIRIWGFHWEWPHLSFAQIFGIRKLRISGLLCGIVYVILCWAASVEHYLWQTDRQTDTWRRHIPC